MLIVSRIGSVISSQVTFRFSATSCCASNSNWARTPEGRHARSAIRERGELVYEADTRKIAFRFPSGSRAAWTMPARTLFDQHGGVVVVGIGVDHPDKPWINRVVRSVAGNIAASASALAPPWN